MTDYNFGDIILVPFPFTDQTTTKKRPAIIVSSIAYNKNRPDVVLMAVTSQVRERAPFGDLVVADWRKAGLLKPSVIKPIFATIDKRLVLNRLGHLAGTDRQALREALMEILG